MNEVLGLYSGIFQTQFQCLDPIKWDLYEKQGPNIFLIEQTIGW